MSLYSRCGTLARLSLCLIFVLISVAFKCLPLISQYQYVSFSLPSQIFVVNPHIKGITHSFINKSLLCLQTQDFIPTTMFFNVSTSSISPQDFLFYFTLITRNPTITTCLPSYFFFLFKFGAAFMPPRPSDSQTSPCSFVPGFKAVSVFSKLTTFYG